MLGGWVFCGTVVADCIAGTYIHDVQAVHPVNRETHAIAEVGLRNNVELTPGMFFGTCGSVKADVTGPTFAVFKPCA